jgi:uncharacterized protein DUF1801
MQPTGDDVAEFLAGVPDPNRRADSQTLLSLLAELTGEEPAIWASSIVGFGSYHYRYESGHEGVAPLAAFAPRKGRTVVYLMADFAARHRSLLEKLGPHKTGKGCLYLKHLDDVDLDVLRELVEGSIEVHRGMDTSNL